MDFCHPCQRHLNGALACPGCGAPAERHAPSAATPFAGHGSQDEYAGYAHAGAQASHVGHPGYAPSGYGEPAPANGYDQHGAYDAVPPAAGYGIPAAGYATQNGFPTGGEGDLPGEPGAPDDTHALHDPGPSEAEDAEGARDAGEDGPGPGEPGGRAARRQARGRGRGAAADDPDPGPAADASRRDRKAAAHRRRRRRTVFIAAGLVLAAGGLSIAELGTDAPFSPFAGDSPASSGDTSADGGTSSASPGRTAAPLNGGSRPSAGPGASASARPSASASGSKSPKDKASASPSASGASQQSATAGAGPATPAPTAPATSAPPAATPTSAPTTSDPTPAPSPTRTCNRFLWWCT